MIGKVAMEVSQQEMIAAMQYYLNNEVFYAMFSGRAAHKANVTKVRQRDNGNFVIEFEGQPERSTDTE